MKRPAATRGAMRRGAGVKLGGSDTKTIPHRLPEIIFFTRLGIFGSKLICQADTKPENHLVTGLALEGRALAAGRAHQVAIRRTMQVEHRAKLVGREADLP